MKIKFYFDPSCPFCWITSRWLLQVSNERDVEVEWQPFSLALKNDELNKEDDNKYIKYHKSAHRILRVIVAAKKEHNANLIDLYSSYGFHFHVNGRDYDDDLIKEILEEKDLPLSLAEEAGNSEYDKKLQEYIDEATSVVGNDIGVPTIVFEGNNGKQNGYFGPVFNELPPKDESLEIWDGLSKIASSKSFYELKRDRPSGGPDTASIAVCEI